MVSQIAADAWKLADTDKNKWKTGDTVKFKGKLFYGKMIKGVARHVNKTLTKDKKKPRDPHSMKIYRR